MKNMRKIIAIVGPTASGKTGLGVAIAKKYSAKGGPASGWNGVEIISADSRQVFRGLDIGTGKEGVPSFESKVESRKSKSQTKKNECHSEFISESPETLKRVQGDSNMIGMLRKDARIIDGIPQWLIDICDPGEPFTMFDWLTRARSVIEDIFSRGKLPVIVGGTGLYVQALVEGFALAKVESKKSPHFAEATRGKKVESHTREKLNSMTLSGLLSIYKKLETKNYLPADATHQALQAGKLETIDANNPRRLIRAIEKAQTGSISGKVKPDFEVLQITLDFPREVLYERIDKRVEEWFSEGFYEEVEGLLDSGVSIEWLNSIGLEYKILANYICCHPRPEAEGYPLGSGSNIVDSRLDPKGPLRGGNDREFDEMKQNLKYKIHNFARRQLTWFRRFPEIVWVKSKKEAFVGIDDFLI